MNRFYIRLGLEKVFLREQYLSCDLNSELEYWNGWQYSRKTEGAPGFQLQTCLTTAIVATWGATSG